MANFLSEDQQARLIRALGLGTPIRHIAHILDLAEETVRRYARIFGDMATDYLDSQQRGMELERLELDEFYHFVFCKEENLQRSSSAPDMAGRVLHFLSVQPGTAFIANYLVAPTNDFDDTCRFIRDLGDRLSRNPDGSFVVKPTLVSDGHGSYEPAIRTVLGTYANHWRLNKQHTDTTPDGKKTRRRFNGVFRESPIGDATEEEFWTNNVESANRTARSQNRRVARRSTTFSKRFDAHVRQFASWIFYHNYCLIPKRKRVTPAMDAGVITRLIDTGEIIRLLGRYQRRMRSEGLLERDQVVPIEVPVPDGVEITEAPFWVYRNFDQYTARIHRGECPHCNFGHGRGGHTGKSGIWLPAFSMEAALDMAEGVDPGRVDACKKCITGDYVIPGKGLRGPDFSRRSRG